jgi:predicted RNase H-like HicB family nuclease
MARRYVAVAERTGQWWAVSVPEVPGVFTQARRLEGPSGVEAMVRDALAVMLEVPGDQIEVEVRPQLPEDLAEAAARVRQARVDAEARTAAATEAAADLARRLTAAGMSVRDAGVVMGVSAQRISQLVHRLDTDGRRAAS